MNEAETRAISENPVILDFIKAWKDTFNVTKTLSIDNTNWGVFSQIDSTQTINLTPLDEGLPNSDTFDLILGCFPWGQTLEEWDFNGRAIKAPSNWLSIIRCVEHLTETGYAIILVEPSAVAQKRWGRFEEELNREGLHLQGVLRAPEKLLVPHTSIIPCFLVIGRATCSDIFVAELSDEGLINSVVRNFAKRESHNSLSEGICIPRSEFSTFNKIKVQKQIERLESQYKNYEERTLSSLAKEIRVLQPGENHVEGKNAVYIPILGNSPVVSSINDIPRSHRKYFQLVLNEEVKSEYVASFFGSDLGKLTLKSLQKDSAITHLYRRDLDDILIAMPTVVEQEQIVSSLHKINRLQSELTEFERELSLNPTSSNVISEKMDSMLELIGALTVVDKIRSLIREGESKTLEFKETLSLCTRKQTKEKYVETSSLKTVVAFLNTNGGILLIGVSDSGETSGLSRDVDKFHNKSSDKFLLHFKNLMKSRIGEQFYPYIDYQLVDVDGSLVLFVNCQPGETACYLDEKDFYVRTNPATDKLEGPKLVDYVKNHFTK